MFEDLLALITESQVRFSGGQKFGQVVFMGGGGGSGKGFAWNTFMEGENFKVFNVDDFKQKFIDAGKAGVKAFAPYKDMDLKNPNDVKDLHQAVKDSKISTHQLHSFFSAHSDGVKSRLPNICFDMTLKDNDDMDEYIPKLVEMGYDPSNIHLVWILTNYTEAVNNNAKRTRKVPENILLDTHEGAAVNLMKNFKQGLPHGLNGKIVVIINNRANTKWMEKESNTNNFMSALGNNSTSDKVERRGKTLTDPKYAAFMKHKMEMWRKANTGPSKILERRKAFKYLILKKEGVPFHLDNGMKGKVNMQVRQNAPMTTRTARIWPTQSGRGLSL